ncbi:DinB family protein [Sphingobacterium sp. E70]|uniref:DinB family protein n=1 Tax=Sphingobacterium sp. E70 TaxID=2853439 RepID=UPI00211BDF07|nr:DinB family protein [Sphingobacterium sp. E70]ULT25998.1 DinB family protein [Sphingobacterium sp. E70]
MQETTFEEFHKTALRLLNILNALTEEQINFQPEEGWSAGQFGDHLLKSYAFVRTLNGETRKTERPIDQKIGTC